MFSLELAIEVDEHEGHVDRRDQASHEKVAEGPRRLVDENRLLQGEGMI